ncbi:MAG: Uncharacterised protein [Flavobacteriales bacterium UBA4585]|nr:MAG: Uncharacterised protein [Flavobacteriales bacterium UBA4585]
MNLHVKLYTPALTGLILNFPSKSVVPVVTTTSRSFTTTVAKGMTSPVRLSLTVPLIDPGRDCAKLNATLSVKTSVSIFLTIESGITFEF